MIWLCRVVIYSGCAVNTGFSISTPSLPLETWTHVAFSHGGFPEVRFSAVHVVLIVVCICLCVRARARAQVVVFVNGVLYANATCGGPPLNNTCKHAQGCD